MNRKDKNKNRLTIKGSNFKALPLTHRKAITIMNRLKIVHHSIYYTLTLINELILFQKVPHLVDFVLFYIYNCNVLCKNANLYKLQLSIGLSIMAKNNVLKIYFRPKADSNTFVLNLFPENNLNLSANSGSHF
jgi:hypothetical protein